MNEKMVPELPENWVWTTLGGCVDILDRKRVPINAKERDERKGNIPYYGATGQVGWIDDYLFDEELVLLGEDGAPFFDSTKNTAYIIRGKSWVNNHAHVLRAIFGVTLNQFLCNYLNNFNYQGYVTGTTRHKLNQSQMRVIPLPRPPLPEQRRIVTKVEELFTRLDAGVGALTKAKAQLKSYRQSVLKSACEGRLVPTEAELARAEGREYEPADVLLERIGKERREKWEAEKTRKGKKSVKYKEPAAPGVSGLPGLPEGWVWTTFGQTFEVYIGATPSRKRPDYWGGRIPWVSSGEVAFCRIRQTRETITELGLTNTSTQVHPSGTVLLGMIGEWKTRGQAAILEIAVCNNQNSAAIRVSESGLSSEYIYNFLVVEYEHTRQIGSGNNQPALNKTRVQSIHFPLPPLPEQHRIVTEIERRLSVADEIEKTVDQSLKQAERLRQSVLKRAFEGKLVSQDPNDEPASVLLERIKAEKAKREAEKKTKNKRKRKGNPKQKKSI